MKTLVARQGLEPCPSPCESDALPIRQRAGWIETKMAPGRGSAPRSAVPKTAVLLIERAGNEDAKTGRPAWLRFMTAGVRGRRATASTAGHCGKEWSGWQVTLLLGPAPKAGASLLGYVPFGPVNGGLDGHCSRDLRFDKPLLFVAELPTLV